VLSSLFHSGVHLCSLRIHSAFIHVLFNFIDNHSFEFFEISSTSLLLEFLIVELLTSGGVVLPYFSIFLFCIEFYTYEDKSLVGSFNHYKSFC
jgi:hypothetical protein